MNFLTLTNEIADWLQQDLSGTNVVWSKADIQSAIKQSMTEFGELKLRDVMDESVEYSASKVSLPAAYLAPLRFTFDSEEVPLIDVRKVDLIGIDGPLNAIGTAQYVGEMYDSNGDQILRIIPQTSDTSLTADLWYKARLNVPNLDDDLIELNDCFIPLIKYRALGILYAQNTAGKDLDKSKLFNTLTETVKSIVIGLFPIGDVVK